MKIKQVVALLAVLAILVLAFLPQIIGMTIFVGSWVAGAAFVPQPHCNGGGG